ncbi:hypothetical protein OIU91_43215 (plasmid) [Streptomyces sp. NBC_01456]|uniref:hypothetical protein n=1 Tax=Streptomyces sp. NBC_01456 TaxID=2975868 RepID=UPI002E36AFC8|nr:hypothetical protein [Streptomyces sp. NBC_01456]
MDLSKTPGQLANEAADAIRALNHKTLNDSYEHPPAVGETAYALRTLIERMPQALEQMERALLDFGSTNAIRMDDGTEPTAAAAECVAAIAVAQPLLKQLQAELAIVSARTSHMGGHWPEDDD